MLRISTKKASMSKMLIFFDGTNNVLYEVLNSLGQQGVTRIRISTKYMMKKN